MAYREFLPHPLLRSYIDAYWVMKGDQEGEIDERIYPDGCIDIIYNLGSEFLTDNRSCVLHNEGVYLVGTMLRYKDITRELNTTLLGIRFKPLGFPAFFQFASLHEITEKTIEFSRAQVPDIRELDEDTLVRLDKFFYDRLPSKPNSLYPVMDTILANKGTIAIEKVAKQHFITPRQLERNFKRDLGVSPKEYANFVRYQHAMQLMKKMPSSENLLDIAIDSGYYDHAHLTNEIKKYSGLLPSQIQKVGFFQTINIPPPVVLYRKKRTDQKV
jgi:AraC-like DNA-binding protein